MEVRKDRCKAPIHGEGDDITSPSGELQDGLMTAWWGCLEMFALQTLATLQI